MTARTPSHEPVKTWSGSVKGELDAFLEYAKQKETYPAVIDRIEGLVSEFKRERGR